MRKLREEYPLLAELGDALQMTVSQALGVIDIMEAAKANGVNVMITLRGDAKPTFDSQAREKDAARFAALSLEGQRACLAERQALINRVEALLGKSPRPHTISRPAIAGVVTSKANGGKESAAPSGAGRE